MTTQHTTASGAANAGLHALADRIEEAQGRAICISVESADYLREALAASAPVAPAPQPAAPQGDGDMLRAHAEGRVTHINNGLCPDIIEGHDTRDPECPVCQALLENHAAPPAPPQGAAKGAT